MLKLTQEEFAARAGIGTSTLEKIEQARGPFPRMNTINSIAQALGMTRDQLLAGKPSGDRASKSIQAIMDAVSQGIDDEDLANAITEAIANLKRSKPSQYAKIAAKRESKNRSKPNDSLD